MVCATRRTRRRCTTFFEVATDVVLLVSVVLTVAALTPSGITSAIALRQSTLFTEGREIMQSLPIGKRWSFLNFD